MKNISLTEFKKALYSGIVEFVYTKKNGDKRHAIGTLSPTLLESVASGPKKDDDNKPKRKLPETSVFYYDCEKKAFRSFVAENLISYKTINN